MARFRVPVAVAVSVVALLTVSCRHDAQHLEDVQKMVYAVKPAVVRINAYATAHFRYEAAAVKALEQIGGDVVAEKLTEEQLSVDTGSGGSGSGFVIHPDGHILTSGHVVAPTRDPAVLRRELLRNGAIAALMRHFPVDELRRLHRDDALEKYIAALAATGRIDDVAEVNDVELSNGEKLPFRIESFSPALSQRGTDLALLMVNRKNLPVVVLGDSDSIRVGDSIWSFGYPAVASSSDEIIGGWLSRESDLVPTMNPGTITAIKTNIANTPVFQSNVAIYRGNSGGPAVTREGEVVAISTWGHTAAEQIKFLVPINVARTFVSAAKVPLNVQGDFTRHYRAALDAAAEGRWVTTDHELALADPMFRNSPDMIVFRRDTARALKGMPLWRQHPLASASIAIAVASVLVLLAMPLVTRSARRRLPKDLDVATTIETIVNPNGREQAEGGGHAFPAPSVLGKFTILNGTRAGTRLGLGGSGIRIGRESTICEIVLENPKVSRLHAEVVSIDGKVLLIDRNSSNGTYVNDQKIDKRFLKDGDIIYFGGRNAIAVAFHA
jgi:S1-C subfamily serine protease